MNTDTTFTGTSGAWTNSASWSNGVPTACTRVHIPGTSGTFTEVTAIPAGAAAYSLEVGVGVRLRDVAATPGSLTVSTTLQWTSDNEPTEFDNAIDVDITVNGLATFGGDGDTYAEGQTITLLGESRFDSQNATPLYLDIRAGGKLITYGTARVVGAGLSIAGSDGVWESRGLLQLQAANLQGPGNLLVNVVTLEARNSIALDTTSELKLDAANLDMFGNVTGTGTIHATGLSDVQGKSWLSNTDSAQVQFSGATLRMDDNGVLHGLYMLGSGTLQWNGGHLSGLVSTAGGVAVNAAGIDQMFVDVSAQVTFFGASSVTGTIYNSGNIFSNFGTMTLGSTGVVESVENSHLKNYGTLKGTGLVSDLEQAGDNAIISPGDPIGTLTVGSYFGAAKIRIEIQGTTAGTFDVLNVTGTASFLGARLELITAEGLVLPIGAQLRIIPYLSRFGEIGTSSSTGFTAPAGRRYALSYVDPPAANTGAYLTVEDRPVVPVASIADTTVAEGDPGAPTSAVFTISLSEAIAQDVRFTFGTSDGTAKQPADYAYVGQFVTVPAGQKSVTVTVPVYGDRLFGGNKTFTAEIFENTGQVDMGDSHAVATIVENETAPTLAVADLTTSESGTPEIVVTRSGADGAAASAKITSVAGTAESPADYTALSTTVSFAAGQTTAKVPLIVVDDAADEPDETLKVKLSEPSGASLADGEATVTITDNDEPVKSVIVELLPITLTTAWATVGVPVPVFCRTPCVLSLEVYSGARAAALGSAAKAVLLGKASKRLAKPGKARVVVKLSRKGKAYVRRIRLKTIIVKVTARDSAGNTKTVKRTVKVPKRRR